MGEPILRASVHSLFTKEDLKISYPPNPTKPLEEKYKAVSYLSVGNFSFPGVLIFGPRFSALPKGFVFLSRFAIHKSNSPSPFGKLDANTIVNSSAAQVPDLRSL